MLSKGEKFGVCICRGTLSLSSNTRVTNLPGLDFMAKVHDFFDVHSAVLLRHALGSFFQEPSHGNHFLDVLVPHVYNCYNFEHLCFAVC